MANFDMPLKQLKHYKGINPPPDDLGSYWKEALEELENFSWEVNLTPSLWQFPGVDCFDLYFTGVGGVRVYGKYLRPQIRENKIPAILEFHGYHGNSGDWSDKLKYIQAGFSIASMDCRGQGGKSHDTVKTNGPTMEGQIIRGLEEGKNSLHYRALFLDTVQLFRIVASFDENDEKRIGVTGQSQGGALSLACASLEPRVKGIASLYPFLSDYKRAWELDLDESAYREIKTWFRKRDPLHEKEEEVFRTLGYIDIKNLVGKIKGSVLMAISLDDKVCPPSTQFATYNRIKSSKRSLIYPDFGHEPLPGVNDHILTFFKELL